MSFLHFVVLYKIDKITMTIKTEREKPIIATAFTQSLRGWSFASLIKFIMAVL
jgi:hypothetical protein